MILGVVMVNLLAVSAMAAIFGGHALVDKVATLAHRLFAPSTPVALAHTPARVPRPTTHREAPAPVALAMAAPMVTAADAGRQPGFVRPLKAQQRRAMPAAVHPRSERAARGRAERMDVPRHVARPTDWHPDRTRHARSRDPLTSRARRAEQAEAARAIGAPVTTRTLPARSEGTPAIDRQADARREEGGLRSPVDEPRAARERPDFARRDRAAGRRAGQGRRFGAGQRGGFGRGRRRI
ncbi:MAG: hypothetical protein J0I47_00720 [Sphingomonas sp.]|uniref:hypothetical protein n=1 Tax=Sphingomonas sp. TaxID=28214 RepID=UPI001ACB5F1C|nr:hypothetical protein [Sphingomonas sp.]MBN8806752.1 hypothetical protein [Sphingomonas sp.]